MVRRDRVTGGGLRLAARRPSRITQRQTGRGVLVAPVAVLLTVLSALAGASPAVAQRPDGPSAEGPARPSHEVRRQETTTRLWTLVAGGAVQRVSDLNGWGRGPELLFQRARPGRFGPEASITVLLASDGFYDFGGVTLAVGAARAVAQGPVTSMVSIGGAALAGGDSDGSYLYRGGAYAASTWFAWLGAGAGIQARGALRLWHDGELEPAFSAGLAFRW